MRAICTLLFVVSISCAYTQDRDSVNRDTISNSKLVSYAEFPGGIDSMFKFIEKNRVYPKDALKMGIEGRIFVEFTVNEDGSISDINVKKGINLSLDKEAIRIISIFPKWNPRMENGRPVKSQFYLPVPFKLP